MMIIGEVEVFPVFCIEYCGILIASQKFRIYMKGEIGILPLIQAVLIVPRINGSIERYPGERVPLLFKTIFYIIGIVTC